LDELEGDGVHAVAQAGGLGAVVEDVAEVSAAAGAEDLGALHAVGAVGVLVDVGGVKGLEEAGPAGAGVELGVALEERQAAEAADVDAVELVVGEVAAEGRLGALGEDDLGLVGGELLGELLDLGAGEGGDVVGGGGVARGVGVALGGLGVGIGL